MSDRGPAPLTAEIEAQVAQVRARFDMAFHAMLESGAGPASATPSDVVYTDNRRRLLHFRPLVPQPAAVPVLIVPSFLYPYAILDLIPRASLVYFLVAHGLDVYLLDWGTPAREDRAVPFDQYITGYLRRAVRHIRDSSGQEGISLLGYSLGGTLTAIYSALYPDQVRNLVQLAAPINFHDDGLLSQWIRKGGFNVDLVVDTLASMPMALMRASFRMLKPTTLIMQRLALASRLGDTQAVQDFLALQTWIPDDLPYLGEAYRQYIKSCYQENYLVKGKLVVGDRRVDLARITCPLLTIAARDDMICPPASATVLTDLVATEDKQVLELTGGHVGMVAGAQAPVGLWPQLGAWLLPRSAGAPPGA